MKYSRFEALLIGAGALTVLGNILFIYPQARVFEEVVGQLLLLGVLAGAVHWGRKGGLLAAIIASVVYTVMRVPLLTALGGLEADVVGLVGLRVTTYGIIGVLGGELCGRLKYVFARLETSDNIDGWSGVYNQRHIAVLLDSAVAELERYGAEFSLATITVDPAATSGLRPARLRKVIHSIANHIRNDIRLVDEVARLDDGSFLILLPHTPKPGGEVVVDRLRRGIAGVIASGTDQASTRVLGGVEDASAIAVLRESLGGHAAADTRP